MVGSAAGQLPQNTGPMRLIGMELFKLLSKPRTYISPGILVLLIGLIFWALAIEGEKVLDFAFQALEKTFFIQGEIINGAFVCFLIMNTLWIHLPILLVIVTGDVLGSEFESGTVRLILSRPISRIAFLWSKFAITILYSAFLVGVLLLFAYFPAKILFGNGDLLVMMEGLQVIPEQDLSLRFYGAFLYAVLGMGSLGVLSVSLAVFTRKSLSAILIALGFLIVSTLVQTLGPQFFPGWQNLLLTYHLSQWQMFFRQEIAWPEIQHSALWLFGFALLSAGISFVKFNRLNITE